MISSEARDRLLYFSPATAGGLADYAREQANELARLGVEVDLLTAPGFPAGPGDAFHLRPELGVRPRRAYRLFNRVDSLRRILTHYRQLADLVQKGNYRQVLLGSFAEYLAPLWANPLHRLADNGVTWGAMVHDPVRDFIVGPKWWHQRSIADAYSFLREAFVHEPILLDTVLPMPHLRTTVIPHGPYAFPGATLSREQYRNELGVPPAAEVWLAFGHIRDAKNLDLVIPALAEFPGAILIIAGKEQSSAQKPVEFYRTLARRCGVEDRCRWLNRFIDLGEVGNLFMASDIVLLTYSRNFRSASGVLNTAVHFRRPCLASGGQGNLKTMVAQYDLGIWAEPDSTPAIIDGLRRWKIDPPRPRWEPYAANNSWRRNAEIVKDRMFGPRA